MSDNINGFPVPEKPETREEQYLSAIAQVTPATQIPPKPLTRVEAYLNKIVENGTGGGGGGTTNYNALENKPQINSHELSGNKSSADLGLQSTLTTAQQAAVDSGIDSAKVQQISTNETNILLKANSSDVNTATASLQAQIDNINELVLTSDKEVMNNTNGNAGTYVILANMVIYNTSYQMTKCLKFDYDVYVIIETDSGDIRHGEFNSTELTDLHSSEISGINFPFKLNKDYYHRFSFTAGKTYSIRIIAPYQTITDSNRLVGKKVYGFGDSLMGGHYSGEGMLTGLCRDNGMQFTNYAINGATVHGSTGGYNITNQITEASQTVPDFVVVDGMTNDLATSTDLGQLTDSYSSNDFDLNTYYGALENELYTLRNKYMTANIIYVIQHRMPTRDKAAQDSFVDATLKTCAKWSIPVVNIYDDGQINCYLDNMRNAYSYNNEGETSGGNGTHLTGTGYNKWYAPIIKAKMLEILA